MSNVIDFLEVLARSPKGFADREVMDAAALLAPGERAAIEARDAAALGQALHVSAVVACYIKAPDNDEPVPHNAPADDDEQPADPESQVA